jgi:hypothetical protein
MIWSLRTYSAWYLPIFAWPVDHLVKLALLNTTHATTSVASSVCMAAVLVSHNRFIGRNRDCGKKRLKKTREDDLLQTAMHQLALVYIPCLETYLPLPPSAKSPREIGVAMHDRVWPLMSGPQVECICLSTQFVGLLFSIN